MEFRGHECRYVMSKHWLLDLTEYKLYRVYKKPFSKENEVEYKCRWVLNDNELKADITDGVPFGVLRMAINIITEYNKQRGSTADGVQRTPRGEEIIFKEIQ